VSSTLDLETLLERCRQGDGLAWEALVRRYQNRVYGLALHYMRNEDEARDLAQEIFIRIYRMLDRVGSAETFVPWMLRVGRNLCIDRIRRVRARPPASDLPVEEGFDIASPSGGPEENAARSEKAKLVYEAMGRMSEINREMILLKEIQGLTLGEISEMLSIPLGTAKTRSMRARLELARTVLELDPSYVA
jgi:RNA polymerase sigma-70 factor (ECF subfamily)